MLPLFSIKRMLLLINDNFMQKVKGYCLLGLFVLVADYHDGETMRNKKRKDDRFFTDNSY